MKKIFLLINYHIMKETKFYPSFVIHNEENLVDFLDVDSAEDVEYYKSVSSFNDCFSHYDLMN